VGGSPTGSHGAGEAVVHAIPPSNLPPLGGGNGRVHTAVDHQEGCSFSEIALSLLQIERLREHLGIPADLLINSGKPPRTI
jgi:hypothetical protein